MKKHYNQPAVHVAHLASMTLMQAASPAPTSGTMNFIPEEGNQW